MSVATSIRDQVEQTPFVDTHEHLVEESLRLRGGGGSPLLPCDDWALVFHHYLHDDLTSAGMSGEDRSRFFSDGISAEEKYRLVAPWWELTKHTGYGQAVRHTSEACTERRTSPRRAPLASRRNTGSCGDPVFTGTCSRSGLTWSTAR